MMKPRAFLTLAVFALACGSNADDEGGEPAGDGGTAGSAGTNFIPIGGSAGNTGSGGSGTSGTSGEIPNETAETLREKACTGWSNEPELLPTVLQLVVDTSLSMDESPDGGRNGPSKWEITRDALRTALDSLPDNTSLGLLYYPGMSTSAGEPEDEPRDVSECVDTDGIIPIDLLEGDNSAQREALDDSLSDTDPAGSTPTHDAYRFAYENGMVPYRGGGNRFMLLITDGAPTFGLQCTGSGLPGGNTPTQPIIDEVFRVREEGVRSFLIGSPGSESARDWMSEAAILGGTARSGCSVTGPEYCHIDLTEESDFSAALNAALARILGQIVSCSFELPSPPSGQELNLSQINVIYSPGGGAPEELVGRDDSSTCSDGWQLDSGNRVVLCPAMCERVQSNPSGQVELLFGCDTTVIDDVK